MSESEINMVKPEDVRVRFAPSPTGDLHVGGVRTALFNYLYARHTGGKFLLRIEDTDKQRSTPEAVKTILNGLEWLGLEPDEVPVYQSRRIDKHIAAARILLDKGHAYRCFCTTDEIIARRQEKDEYMYDRHCLIITDSEIEDRLSGGDEYAVRLMIPPGKVSFNDGVHGKIEVSCEEIDDFILLRRNGTPTYMLAVVVDDGDMQVTHIIRGDDHITNTPKQILLYRALERPLPEFAHMPLILGPDKKRLSKRHGAVSITWYRDAGYLPETMINYIGLLGWSTGDDRDIISRRELVELFDISGIQSRGAVFDETKLHWLNGQYIGKTDFKDIASQLKKLAEAAVADGRLDALPTDEQLHKGWNLVNNRIFFLKELFDDFGYILHDPETYDKKGVKKHFNRDGALDRMIYLTNDLDELEVFDAKSVEYLLRSRAEEWQISASKLIHPIRLACSGVTGGPGLFELLEVLGTETVVRRMQKAVEWHKTNINT